MTLVRPADVTVAISTVDRPASLERCVAAVLGGRLLPAEIVIVDQSADIATEHAVRRAAASASVPIRYIRQARRGLAASRNLALTHATARVVAFTDDDCVPDEGWVAHIAAAFDAPSAPAAVTGRILPLGPDRPDRFAVSSRPSAVRRTYRGRTLPWAVGSGGNTAVQREWLVRIGGFDESLGAESAGQAAEDTDLLYRLLLARATVQYEPSATVFHQRQDRARRLASRSSYGFGMGAFCGKWARQADPYAMQMLACWTVERLRTLAASIVRLRSRGIREELMMLGGAARGFLHGLSFSPVHDKCLRTLAPGSSSSV